MEEEQKQERSSDQQEQENIIPSAEALQSDTVARASTPRWDGTVAPEQIITVVRSNGSIRRRIVARKVVNLGRCSTKSSRNFSTVIFVEVLVDMGILAI